MAKRLTGPIIFNGRELPTPREDDRIIVRVAYRRTNQPAPDWDPADLFRPWVRKFPDRFFTEVLRIYGHTKGQGNQRPRFIGNFINEYIYGHLLDGDVLDELRRVNPVLSSGRRSRTHHQHVVEGTGSTHLDRQITAVITLLSISRDADQFKTLFAQAFPKTRQVLTVRPTANGDVEKLFELEDFEQ